MKVYIGADHNGFAMKDQLVENLKRQGVDVVDNGDHRLDPNDDYPQFAAKVVASVLSSDDKEPRGILLCGSGQGMCIAANRYKGIRAMLGYDRESVRSARHDDDANILCLPARLMKEKDADVLVATFLETPFGAAPRYIRRIREIDENL